MIITSGAIKDAVPRIPSLEINAPTEEKSGNGSEYSKGLEF